MIAKNDGNSWSYSYDYDDRLTEVKRNKVSQGNYTYYGDNMRMKKQTSSKTEVFGYQGFNILFEKDTG